MYWKYFLWIWNEIFFFLCLYVVTFVFLLCLNIWKSCSDLISLCSPCWNVPILQPCFLLRNSVSSLIQSIDESYVWLIVLFISSISVLFFFWIPFSYVALGSSIHSAVCLYSLGILLRIHLLFFDFFEHTHNHFLSSLPEFFFKFTLYTSLGGFYCEISSCNDSNQKWAPEAYIFENLVPRWCCCLAAVVEPLGGATF